MKHLFSATVFFLLLFTAQAQQVIRFPYKAAGTDLKWNPKEGQKKSRFGNQMVHNVSVPTLIAYLPDPKIATGAALIIAPGGGFHLLSIDNEGTDMGEWCKKNGIAAFVLKYRLYPTGDDPEQEFFNRVQNGQAQMDSVVAPYIQLAVDDGLSAIAYVRENAAKFKIKTDKIGIVGFSAGGTVAAGAALQFTSAKDKPNFVAPVYPALHVLDPNAKPDPTIPVFLSVTSDDFFKFQLLCLDFYRRCNVAGVPVEMHIYEKGQHGHGMKKQGYTSDDWITAFRHWMKMKKFI